MVQIYMMEYYSTIKGKNILPFAATSRDLEGIRTNGNKSDKDKYTFTYMWNLKANKPNRNKLTEENRWFLEGSRVEEMSETGEENVEA